MKKLLPAGVLSATCSLLLFAGLVLAFTACPSGGGGGSSKPTVTSVTVDPLTATVTKGGTQQFTAVVDGSKNPAQTVTWEIVGTVVSGTTISASGLLTVMENETATAFTVKATSTVDTSKSGTASVTVNDAVSLSGTVTITGNVKSGETLTANTSSLGGSGTITYQWKRANDATGAGSTNIGTNAATYKLVAADETKFIGVTVSRADNAGSISSTWAGPVLAAGAPDPTVTHVTVTTQGNAVIINTGGTLQFNAVVHGEHDPAQSVTWTISTETPHVAGTTISGSGLLTVAADETAALLTVRATSTVDTSKHDEASVAVISGTPTVNSVTITPYPIPPLTSISVGKGQSQQFFASVVGILNPATTVTWEIVGTVKAGTTISTNGLLTIDADETATQLTVKATSTFDTSKSDTVRVTIPAVTPDLTGMVSITGTARVDSMLSANITQLLGTGTVTYQWKRANDQAGTGSVNIGANAATYVPVPADEGKYIIVTVTRSGYRGEKSAVTASAVAAAPPVDTTGTVTGSIVLENGIERVEVGFDNAGDLVLSGTSLEVTVTGSYQSYQWFVNGIELTAEKGNSLTLLKADYEVGKTYRILVIVTKNYIPYSHAIPFKVQ